MRGSSPAAALMSTSRENAMINRTWLHNLYLLFRVMQVAASAAFLVFGALIGFMIAPATFETVFSVMGALLAGGLILNMARD